MKNLNTLLIAIFFSSILISCYKDAYKVDPNFVGVWRGNQGSNKFEIGNSGVGSTFWNNQGEKIVDEVKIYNDKLKIGNKKFSINQNPRLDSTLTINFTQYEYYSMILDGEIYINYKIKV